MRYNVLMTTFLTPHTACSLFISKLKVFKEVHVHSKHMYVEIKTGEIMQTGVNAEKKKLEIVILVKTTKKRSAMYS